jgi:N6-L-threonylcarbamoyladenine synthase
MTILAIESSCDDTSAAVIRDGEVLSNIMAAQLIHQKYGGVLPEAASRAHQVNILPVVEEALRKANVQKKDLTAIAFTRGPGLMGSLMVGVSFAKGLALSLNLPMIAVNHIAAHVLAHFIKKPAPSFPFVCLTVSGGHTQLMLVRDYLDMEVIGTTLDDAAGEAFDKTGKLMGLPYPAGAILDKLARTGNPRFEFKRPEIEGLNFSFSGLKTQFMRFLQTNTAQDPDFIQNNLPDICASVQHRIVEFLIYKLEKAAKLYKVKEIAIAGGVSANSGLRQAVQTLGDKYGWKVYIPEFQYCTDNAGMIAITAHYQALKGDFVGQEVAPLARFEV